MKVFFLQTNNTNRAIKEAENVCNTATARRVRRMFRVNDREGAEEDGEVRAIPERGQEERKDKDMQGRLRRLCLLGKADESWRIGKE